MTYGPKPPNWREPPYESDYAASATAFFDRQISASSLRTMLHLIANDLGIDDEHKMMNPITLTRLIRQEIMRRTTTDEHDNSNLQS